MLHVPTEIMESVMRRHFPLGSFQRLESSLILRSLAL